MIFPVCPEWYPIKPFKDSGVCDIGGKVSGMGGGIQWYRPKNGLGIDVHRWLTDLQTVTFSQVQVVPGGTRWYPVPPEFRGGGGGTRRLIGGYQYHPYSQST